MLAHQAIPADIVVIADQDALIARAKTLNIQLEVQSYQVKLAPSAHAGNGKINVLHQATANAVVAGKLDKANSAYV